MKRIPIPALLISSFALMSLGPAAVSETVAVGICLPHLKIFPTISQAVSSVTPGSTIEVCPGTYPEQVIITQPLTLRGVQAGNADNPTITVPAGGLTKSVVAPTNSANMFFQILVQGTESGM